MSKSSPTPSQKSTTSSLDFDPDILTQGIRVNQATFAKMMGVTKQAVNQWILLGKVTLEPDGKIDPVKAAQEVIDKSDPGRIRAKMLKAPVNEISELRAQLKDAQKRIEAMEIMLDEYGIWESLLKEKMLLLNAQQLADLADDGPAFNRLVERLLDDALIVAGMYLGNIYVSEEELNDNQLECLDYLDGMASASVDEEGGGDFTA